MFHLFSNAFYHTRTMLVSVYIVNSKIYFLVKVLDLISHIIFKDKMFQYDRVFYEVIFLCNVLKF